jgi:multiple sugar transport system permease protein
MANRNARQPAVARRVLIYFFAILSGILMLFPYVWIFITSFENEIDAVTLPPFPIRNVQFTLANYVYTLIVTSLPKAIINSAIVAVASAILVLTISAWAAYAMSKIRFRGRNILYSALIILYMIPGLPMLIPIVILFKELQIIDTLLGLTIAHGIILIPLMTWMLVGVFDSVPKDLDEAARADGLSRFFTIMRVNMPLAKTGLALILVFSFTISWNELMFSNTIGLVNTPMLQPAILDYTLGSTVNFAQMAAGAILSSLPIIVLAYMLQRYIISGIMKGAIK